MRLLIPGVRLRRLVHGGLGSFFEDYQNADFDGALQLLCTFYEVRRPRVEWFQYIAGGDLLGETTEDGLLRLVHPEFWKRSDKHTTTKAQWLRTVYHEFAHYLLWSDAEPKAELYERRFIEGLRAKE